MPGYPPKVGRRHPPGTPQRARERANAADGPFSAACSGRAFSQGPARPLTSGQLQLCVRDPAALGNSHGPLDSVLQFQPESCAITSTQVMNAVRESHQNHGSTQSCGLSPNVPIGYIWGPCLKANFPYQDSWRQALNKAQPTQPVSVTFHAGFRFKTPHMTPQRADFLQQRVRGA